MIVMPVRTYVLYMLYACRCVCVCVCVCVVCVDIWMYSESTL